MPLPQPKATTSIYRQAFTRHTPIPTFKEVVGHYLTHEHSGPIIYQVVGSFPPMIPHDL
jgi:hypothetical protein